MGLMRLTSQHRSQRKTKPFFMNHVIYKWIETESKYRGLVADKGHWPAALFISVIYGY
jgi:hypothetical protein